jgi:hypothetical protein
MRSTNQAVFIFAIGAVIGFSGAFAQAKSGLYGNLTLGVDGTTVTGVFSDARVGNGTDDAPQFSCLFALRGVLAGEQDSIVKVKVWSPGGSSIGVQLGGAQANITPPSNLQASGTLTFEKDAAKLRLLDDPSGCAATGDEFVSAAYEEPSVKDGKWTSVRLVRVASADVREAPVDSSSVRTRLTVDDVVAIYRRIGPWLEGEDLNARRRVRGWLREMDLAPDQP